MKEIYMVPKSNLQNKVFSDVTIFQMCQLLFSDAFYFSGKSYIISTKSKK